MRSGGMSRGQYQSPFLLRRSQDRGTSSSRTTVLSIRPPCRRTTWAAAQSVLSGEQTQTAGVPVGTLRKWQGDRGMPGLPAALRLAAALGVPFTRLDGDTQQL
jgi:hypothetical protein